MDFFRKKNPKHDFIDVFNGHVLPLKRSLYLELYHGDSGVSGEIK
jgi:hypothetical protein